MRFSRSVSERRGARIPEPARQHSGCPGGGGHEPCGQHPPDVPSLPNPSVSAAVCAPRRGNFALPEAGAWAPLQGSGQRPPRALRLLCGGCRSPVLPAADPVPASGLFLLSSDKLENQTPMLTGPGLRHRQTLKAGEGRGPEGWALLSFASDSELTQDRSPVPRALCPRPERGAT